MSIVRVVLCSAGTDPEMHFFGQNWMSSSGYGVGLMSSIAQRAAQLDASDGWVAAAAGGLVRQDTERMFRFSFEFSCLERACLGKSKSFMASR